MFTDITRSRRRYCFVCSVFELVSLWRCLQAQQNYWSSSSTKVQQLKSSPLYLPIDWQMKLLFYISIAKLPTIYSEWQWCPKFNNVYYVEDAHNASFPKKLAFTHNTLSTKTTQNATVMFSILLLHSGNICSIKYCCIKELKKGTFRQ